MKKTLSVKEMEQIVRFILPYYKAIFNSSSRHTVSHHETKKESGEKSYGKT